MFQGWLAKVRVSILTVLALASPVSAQAPDAGLRGHGGPIRAIAVMPNGRVASAGFDGAIIIWDVNGGRAERVLRFHESAVNALTVRSDGCLVSGGDDGKIGVWCGDVGTPKQVLSGHSGPVSALVLVPPSPLDQSTRPFHYLAMASGSWDHTVRYWPTSGSDSAWLDHTAPVTSIAFSNDKNTMLSSSNDGQVKLTNLRQQLQPLTLKRPTSVNAVAALSNNHFLLASADGKLQEVGPELKIVREVELPDGPLTTVAVSPDGKAIAIAGMRTPVTLIDAQSFTVKSRIFGPGLPIWALAFSADSRELYTGGADRALRRFDVATGQPNGNSIAPASRTELPEPKDRGAQVFRACLACHGLTAADTNLAGPTLAGIMGRRIASAPGYAFSDPLKKLDIVWTPETISKLFEVGPTLYTPGTKMPEQRLTDPNDRKALVEWLARVTVH